ncbi:MAG: dihydroneopterin aldolase [Candidatus Omnitrophota bacterium]|jgi:dihydroneopterin aldolase
MLDSAAMRDKVLIEGLEARGIIGILGWERKIRQKVVLDLELTLDFRKAARTDQIADALDYRDVAKSVRAFVSKSRYSLLETLAEELSRLLLKQFPVRALRLRLWKPGAVPHAKRAGVEIIRPYRNKTAYLA